MNFTTLAYNALLQVLGIVVVSVHHGRRNVPVGAAVLTAGTDEGLWTTAQNKRTEGGNNQQYETCEKQTYLCNPVLRAVPGLPPQAAAKSPLRVASFNRKNDAMFTARLQTPLWM